MAAPIVRHVPVSALTPKVERTCLQSDLPSISPNRGRFGFVMRPDQRIVTKLPLTELWDERGTVTRKRVRNLDQNNLAELLRAGPLRFVMADCGVNLRWIAMEERFEFWKTVRPQIANPLKPMGLHEYPNETAYTASEWHGRTGERVILLEKHH